MASSEVFRSRVDAGRRLGEVCRKLDLDRPFVLALARGGVAVGAEVAKALDADLDVLVVQKIGHPDQPELAVGAVSEGGAEVFDNAELRRSEIAREVLDEIITKERRELQRRLEEYREGKPLPSLREHDVVVVDDGLATGLSASAAVRVVRNLGAGRVILAVPVASRSAVGHLRRLVDRLVCLEEPARFFAVGEWYQDFNQLTDNDVKELLAVR